MREAHGFSEIIDFNSSNQNIKIKKSGAKEGARFSRRAKRGEQPEAAAEEA